MFCLSRIIKRLPGNLFSFYCFNLQIIKISELDGSNKNRINQRYKVLQIFSFFNIIVKSLNNQLIGAQATKFNFSYLIQKIKKFEQAQTYKIN
ncbi:hypothetical protein ABPG72_018317, partial [Tetrahymena utriculariae]